MNSGGALASKLAMATPRSFPPTRSDDSTFEARITVTASLPPTPERPADECPIGVHMLDLASKLGAMLSEAHVIPTSGATPGAGLLSDIAIALTEGASSLLGKQALLRQLMDAYTAAGGEGVATLGAIEAAITRGVGVTNGLRDLSAAYLEALGEPVGAWTPSIADMRAAILIGADPQTASALAGEDSLLACKVRLEALGKVYEEASGGKKPTMQDLKNAIHRGAR